jgi:NAD(P)-dependent dehydrogenase (short-subunit alcohol dehydrogenase family)
MSWQGRHEGTRCAVVTGASQGIGSAVLAELLREGWEVWAVARSCEPLERLAHETPGGQVHPVKMDVAADDAGRLVDDVRASRQQLAGVVHCAGILEPGSLASTDTDSMLATLRVNLVAPVTLTAALVPFLPAGATVVFVNSTQGLTATGGFGAYAASKHALKGAADALRADLSGTGIRVSSIYPGRTATPMQEMLYAMRGDEYDPRLLIQPATIATIVLGLLTLPPDIEMTDVRLRPAVKSY